MSDERQGKISASAAWQLYQCPGSQRMQAGMPPEVPAAETIQGEEIAEAMASDDFAGLDEDGRTIAQKLQWMIDRALESWGQPNPRIIKEVRMWLYDDNGNPIASAKPDFVAISGNSALIVEEKSGYIDVHRAHSNVQLRLQALCLNAEYPHVTDILGCIAQQRFQGTLSAVRYGPRELAMARQELDFKLWQAEDPDAPLNPGEWCRYCRAKSVCASAGMWAMSPMGVSLRSTEAITEHNVDAIVRRTMTPEQMAHIRKHKSVLEHIIGAIDRALKAMPDDELGKLGLTRTKPSRSLLLPDPKKAHELLVGAGLLTDEQFNECIKVQVGKVEEIAVEKIAAKTRATKKDAKVEFTNMILPIAKEAWRAGSLRASKGGGDE